MAGRWTLRLVGLAVLVASASACGDMPPIEPECPGDPSCPDDPGGGGVVDGVNLAALFAEPSRAEILAVQREASGRPPSVASVETVATLELADREVIRVVAGLDADGDTAFVGAVRTPPRTVGDQRARPLMVVLSQGPDVDVEDAIEVPPLRPGLETEFVTAVMGYRGQSLRVNGQTFTSDLAAEPYDRDADDAVAFIAHARANAGLDRSDPDRVVLLGWGRGGGVALLASARGASASVVMTFGAVTDFFLPDVRTDARSYLLGRQLSLLPEVETVMALSAGAVRDGTKTLGEARLELLKRSPAYLTSVPPPLAFAHGGRDGVVRVEHGRSLRSFAGTSALYLEIEESSHGTILTDGQVVSTFSGLLCQRILASEPVCDG